MKTKLDMAHEWYLKHAGGAKSHMDLEVDLAWKYADAMQAEADKREIKGVPEAIRNYPEIPDSWQPDWSQAPAGFDWFAIDDIGAFWYRKMPTWDGTEWSDYKDFRPGSETECALWFGYEGRLQDSLRKRP